jgi:hypothetical protein
MSEENIDSIIMVARPSDVPPFSGERQDAEIEALRFAFCELARCLHETGVLDMQTLQEGLGNAEWLFSNSPMTLESVRWLSGTLGYMRSKLGPSTRIESPQPGGLNPAAHFNMFYNPHDSAG